MAEFNESVLTKKGTALLAKAQAENMAISITKAVVGSGTYMDGEDLTSMTGLKNQQQEFVLNVVKRKNETNVSVQFTISNFDGTVGLTQGYYVSEIGLIADDPEEGEILYALATANTADFLQAYKNQLPATIEVEFLIEVANADNVTITTDPQAYATREELDAKTTALSANLLMLKSEIENVSHYANDACDIANTAYNSANAAYTQAISAYSRGDAAYMQANTAYNCANAAYTQAISAYKTANNAMDRLDGNTIWIGSLATVAASGAIALGASANASGINAMALGVSANASGSSSVALGSVANTTGVFSVAVGYCARASNSSSVALGYSANAISNNSMALGYLANANGSDSIALGHGARTSGFSSVALGSNTFAIANSTALGYKAQAETSYATALGHNSIASGYGSTALGYSANVASSSANTIQLGASGTLSALKSRVALTVTSDERDKADITEIGSGAVEFLKKVRAIRYVFNHRELYINEENLSEEERKKKRMYGLCAYDKEAHAKGTKKGSRIRVGVSAQGTQKALQEVYGSSNYANLVDDNLFDIDQDEIPEGVESQLSANYEGFIPFLIKAVQELAERLEAVEKSKKGAITV